VFFDPQRLNPQDDYVDEVLVVLPAEWARHQRDGESMSEISNEIDRLNPDIRVTLVFNGTPEERASGHALRCFINPVGDVHQFVLGYAYGGQDIRFGTIAESIADITRAYYERVIRPAG